MFAAKNLSPKNNLTHYYMKTIEPAKKQLHLTKARINSIAASQTLEPETIAMLSPAQKEKLKIALLANHELSPNEEKPGLMAKIALLEGNETVRREIWEENHHTVVTQLSAYLNRHGSMPTNSALALQTGLSRQCIIRHLSTYREEPEYEIQKSKMKIMKTQLMDKVLKQAFKGDMQAAKIYIDTVTKMEDKETDRAAQPAPIRQQNNYFQVNGVVISKEKLEHLAPEQLKTLEHIFSEK
jgi:hypothetical protein